jgi:hypothetical protein
MASRTTTTNSKRQNMIQFILRFVVENDVVHLDVVSTWAEHAKKIPETSPEKEAKIKEWMDFVKNKIGVAKFLEIQRDFDNHCRTDCGFVKLPAANMKKLFVEMSSVTL